MDKVLLVIVLLIFSSQTLACRCDYSLLQNILENPQNSTTAFVSSWKNGAFLVKKNFKKENSSFEVDQVIQIQDSNQKPSKCDLILEEGQSYLILSVKKLTTKTRLTMCDTWALKESEVKDIITKLEKIKKR